MNIISLVGLNIKTESLESLLKRLISDHAHITYTEKMKLDNKVCTAHYVKIDDRLYVVCVNHDSVITTVLDITDMDIKLPNLH